MVTLLFIFFFLVLRLCGCIGMTPLLAAAVTGHTHIVEYIVHELETVGRKEKIDALELLGATFVDRKRDMLGALQYWKQAMQFRCPPPPFPPLPFRKYSAKNPALSHSSIESSHCVCVCFIFNSIPWFLFDEYNEISDWIWPRLFRYENGSTAFPKPRGQSPIAAFENTVEAASQEQLDEAVSDPDEMRMQALLVRERILGMMKESQ